MVEPVGAPFFWTVRVYYEDTDAGGVVYHAGYLRFLERARSEWLRSCGIAQAQLAASDGVLFVVTEIELKFLHPARLDDELRVSCRLSELGGASMRFSQDVVRIADNQPIVRAQVRAACLAAGNFRPRPIPQNLLAELSR